MKIRVDKARKDTKGQHFAVTIHPDRPEAEQFVEEFTYGLDVSLATIRAEFLALLGNKYEEHQEEVLNIEGQEFEL